jgi:dolichol-phosphate mannosyltransferase
MPAKNHIFASSMNQLVIVPTFNEIENIRKMIHAVLSQEENFEMLVVDDGSPDGTGKVVKELQQEFPGRLHLEERIGKQGLGTAYIHGFKWALGRQYDYIFEMDCDFSHNPADLKRLLEACRSGGDVAIGSRYCKGGKIRNWPLGRILMSYFASVYVRIVLWLPVKDTTAGFKCYKRIVLQSIDLDKVRFMGYAFQIEMKYRAYKKGFKLVEVPILFTDRIAGTSKMSTRIFKEAFLGVLQMRFSV